MWDPGPQVAVASWGGSLNPQAEAAGAEPGKTEGPQKECAPAVGSSDVARHQGFDCKLVARGAFQRADPPSTENRGAWETAGLDEESLGRTDCHLGQPRKGEEVCAAWQMGLWIGGVRVASSKDRGTGNEAWLATALRNRHWTGRQE